MVTICDGYGRDIDWIRARAPEKAPSRFAQFINIFIPLQSVELWNTLKMLELEEVSLKH